MTRLVPALESCAATRAFSGLLFDGHVDSHAAIGFQKLRTGNPPTTRS